MLEDKLLADAVAPSPGCLVGAAALSAMAQLVCGEASSAEMRARCVVLCLGGGGVPFWLWPLMQLACGQVQQPRHEGQVCGEGHRVRVTLKDRSAFQPLRSWRAGRSAAL